jgi:hypothetical protein
MTTYRKFWQDMPRMDFVEYVNDFTMTSDYLATDWTITALQGTNTIAVDVDDPNGILLLTTGATENDGSGYNSKIEAWRFAANKALEFEARFKMGDVTQSDFVLGLQVTDTTPFATADGAWFGSDDGDALLDFHLAKGSVQGDLTGLATLVDDTWVKVGFYYDGVDTNVQVFLNDVRVGALPFATNGPTTELCISIALTTGEAVANTMLIDYIRVCQQR